MKRSWGGRDYPVEYTYDYAGRMKTMKTWQNFAGDSGAAVTTWNYNAYRGWLDNKGYADGLGPDYTYYASGRLKERIWARGNPRLKTTYSYNNAGDLYNVDYSDSTADVAYTLDHLGRQKTVAKSGTTTFSYNNGGQVLSETNSGGTLNGLSVTNGYDHLQRRTNVVLLGPGSTVLARTTNSFDPASRFQTIGDGTNLAIYSYIANSPLVSQIDFKTNATVRMTTTKSCDYLNRLTRIASVPAASSAISFDYFYNNANQRIRVTHTDGSYWSYEYDALGQVKSGRKFWADGSPVAGQQFEYGFDDIGNRTSTKAGGDENGANLRPASYTPNSLNQYSSRTVPGAVDVIGIALATNAVTVNSQATYRKGEYFRKELTVANGSVPVWQSVTVTATGETPVTGNSFVPKTPEPFGYDSDGNLTSDGRWTYTWDAENRLIRLVANTAVGPQQRLDFEYDIKGRRIHKQVWPNTGGTGNPTNDVRFLYDGWNLLAVLNPQSSVLQSFLWGLDLSGSLQGAGGIGGLIAIKDAANGHHLAAFDGNGNVIALLQTPNSSLSAAYEYGPFAELIRATGHFAKSNPFRFSTKHQDDETDLLHYGYRYYNTSMGRWLNRDPLGDESFSNQALAKRQRTIKKAKVPHHGNGYALLSNHAIGETDFLGLLSNSEERQFQTLLDKLTAKIRQGEFPPCAAFAYALGELADMDYSRWKFGNAEEFLLDAIRYLTDVTWIQNNYGGWYVDWYLPNDDFDGWAKPLWLWSHNGDPSFGNQGREAGYVQFLGDRDRSGRHDHFLMNALVGYWMYPFDISKGVQDASPTDQYVNTQGRAWGYILAEKGLRDRAEMNRQVFEILCINFCPNGRWKKQGPISDADVK